MENLSSRILEGLNPPQREAVETLDGPLLILAGAGSGKTRVVTRRVANLIAHGVRPWQVLAITFTNKAAAEMRRRVEDLVGQAGVWVSTFHSFCARLLRREATHLGYSSEFTIFDEEDSTGAVKEIVKRLGLSDDKRFSPKNMRHEISRMKNKAQGPDDLDESNYEERLLKKVYNEYQAELVKQNAMDFDDLLRMAVVLFREHPEVLARYQERFRYILVDEYQDTNGSQYHLVKLLGEKHRNVCATGDPDQSIYAWRGADVRNILSFERDFPEAKVVKLEQNYRSTKSILAAADAVIENNVERKKKSLWTENPQGDRISLKVLADEQLESYEVVRRIEAEVRDGRRYSDVAVFYRTNAQSRAIETALVQSSIPYQLIGGTAFYERREVKDALAYMRLLANPKDDLSFRRIINVPKRGLGDSALELIEQQAEKLNCSLLETLEGEHAEAFVGLFKPKPRQALIQFARLFDKLRAMPPYPVEAVLEAALNLSGLRHSLQEAGEDERVDNLDSLLNAAAEYDKDNDPKLIRVSDTPPEPGAFDGEEDFAPKTAGVAGFLENSALLAATDAFDPLADRVTLMTLHMAKGLEFPVVFLTGVEEGLLPLVRQSNPDHWGVSQPEDERAIEEERRLFYVGITRAMNRLYLTRAMNRRRYAFSEVSMPSRFLQEIPDKLLEIQDRTQSGWTQAPRSRKEDDIEDDPEFKAFEQEVSQLFDDEPRRAPGKPAAPAKKSGWRTPMGDRDAVLSRVVDKMLNDSAEESQEDPSALEIGDRVKHDKFGEGVVESISGTGLSTKVKVHFYKAGPKQLLLSLAKLRRV